MQYIKTDTVKLCNIVKNRLQFNEIESVVAVFPFRLTSSYSGLIKNPGDPIWLQCIPDSRELKDHIQLQDPLFEGSLSPVPGVIHRYPDRVVLLVSNRCPVYCRFCMRKRHVGEGDRPLDRESLEKAFSYISGNSSIRDIILSGGDPLMLDDESLCHVLTRLRSIPNVRIIRIGTRMPVTMPERITNELCSMLKRFHPVYVNTHFNHPAELSEGAAAACAMLADSGVQLGNQTVLLAEVNDSVEVMRELMTGLLDIRVRPYYIHQMDLVKGTAHFRTSVSRGIEIIKGLRGHISGLAVPHYVIDLPGGRGKVPVLPGSAERVGDMIYLVNYEGERIAYPDPL
jgi:lysine 2,3-aminomutase